MMPYLLLRDNWVEMGEGARYTRAYVVVSTISLKWINQGRTMLDVFITSRVRRKIIVIYAKYPDFKTHVRGLAKLIKEDAGNIQRELKRLEKAGFLISEKQGNTKIYHTNKQFVIFKELQSIVLKSQRTSQRRNVA
jgi:DNA-binding transcriptional ArsR family regulator